MEEWGGGMKLKGLFRFRAIVMIVICLATIGGISAIIWNYHQENIEERQLERLVVGHCFIEKGAVATMTNGAWLARFDQELNKAQISPTEPATSLTYREKKYWLRLTYGSGEEKLFYANRDLEIFDPQRGWLASRKLKEQLLFLTSRLDQRLYGKPMAWQQVDELWPRKSTAWVRDLETGYTFQVFRFGGNCHADVEPLTADDTAVMQQIYQDWSWKRRAVVVTVGDVQLAASMNAMPHGQGQVMDNLFKGHFCIHFAESKVHKSRQVDPGHQLMILKASNQLLEEVIQATPVELAKLFLTAVANGDLESTQLITQGRVEQNQQLWDRLREELRFVSIEGIEEVTSSQKNETQVLVKLTVTYSQPINQTHQYSLLLNLDKPRPQLGWVAHLEDLAPLAIANDF